MHTVQVSVYPQSRNVLSQKHNSLTLAAHRLVMSTFTKRASSPGCPACRPQGPHLGQRKDPRKGHPPRCYSTAPYVYPWTHLPHHLYQHSGTPSVIPSPTRRHGCASLRLMTRSRYNPRASLVCSDYRHPSRRYVLKLDVMAVVGS